MNANISYVPKMPTNGILGTYKMIISYHISQQLSPFVQYQYMNTLDEGFFYV